MKTFKIGGAHPPEMKEATKDLPLKPFTEIPYVAIPLSQHFGAPAICQVSKGDIVAKGQLIGKADGFMSANVHASISGKVARIENTITPQGKSCEQIIIENDNKNQWAQGIPCDRDWHKLSADEIIKIIAEAGIVGMGGAAFPAHIKLKPPKEKPIDTVVINGVECEPYLTVDHRLMIEQPKTIVEGIQIILKTVGAKKAYIGIEANKPEAYEKIKAQASAELQVEMLEIKYPQGAEKQLIEALTGRKVPPRKLPFDVGVVVQNVATAWAITNAVKHCQPLIERTVTIAGDAIARPANFMVPIGTPIGLLLEYCGISPNTKKIILGGPMMGIAIADPFIPVVKGMSGILAFEKLPSFLSGPCIRCGKCIEVCPLSGMASEMARAIEAGQIVDYDQLHVFDCMECGTCCFVCPAKRPLVQLVKQAKFEAAQKREQKRKSDHRP
ncbi:MAG: electron transport complex subunit RsxC [Pseudomonadota bacterium]